MSEGRVRGRRPSSGQGRERNEPREGETVPTPVPIDEPADPSAEAEGLDDIGGDAEESAIDEGAEGPEIERGSDQPVDLNSLYKMTNQHLAAAARRLGIQGAAGMPKQHLIFEILKVVLNLADVLIDHGQRIGLERLVHKRVKISGNQNLDLFEQTSHRIFLLCLETGV